MMDCGLFNQLLPADFAAASGYFSISSIAQGEEIFQEGDADLYAGARYGIFRVDAGGRHLLTGMADTEAKRIGTRGAWPHAGSSLPAPNSLPLRPS